MKKKSETVPHCVPKTPDLEKAKDDPCWENYVMVGRKPKKSNNEKRSSKMNRRSKNEFSQDVAKRAERMLALVSEADKTLVTLKRDLKDLIKLSKRPQPAYLEQVELLGGDIESSIVGIMHMIESTNRQNNEIMGHIAHRRFRMAEDKSARFHEGPKGEKEFEEWLEDQPQDFQDDWEDNKDKVVEESKKATLSIQEYGSLLRRASTKRRG